MTQEQQAIQRASDLIDEAGRHIECSLYESSDIQSFLRLLKDALTVHAPVDRVMDDTV